MAVEILVLGGKKGIDYRLGDGLDRHKNAPLGRVFGQQSAISSMHAGRNRRLVMSELLIVRQLAAEMPDRDADEAASGNRQDDRADEQKPDELDHCSMVRRRPRLPEHQTERLGPASLSGHPYAPTARSFQAFVVYDVVAPVRMHANPAAALAPRASRPARSQRGKKALSR